MKMKTRRNKDAFFYLIFHRILDKIPMKFLAKMRPKKPHKNRTFITAENFITYFGRNHCLWWKFFTEESTPGVHIMTTVFSI
jgi:hypothetical protein